MKSQQSFPGHHCQNGAECVDGIAQYTCKCARGFEGPLCSNNTDDCASALCLNNATCVDQITNYTCLCSLGFTGEKNSCRCCQVIMRTSCSHSVRRTVCGDICGDSRHRSQDDFRSGSSSCWEDGQCHQKRSFSGLHSTARSYFTDLW